MKIMTNEIHMFVIWHQATQFFNIILQQIEAVAEILDVIQYTCNIRNAITIQQKLYNISFEEAREKCRNGNFDVFIVIIVRLKHSIYIMASTHWGTARVEKHMYTIKNTLREQLNSPYGIHSTIDEKEAEHDIQAMTGKKSSYYANHSVWNKEMKEINL